MPTKIYVGNLPWRATDAQLTQLFGAHGEVTDARIVTDRETGRSRGFGFVTMTVADAAQNAIRALNGHSLEGRSLVVNEAREQQGGGGGGVPKICSSTLLPRLVGLVLVGFEVSVSMGRWRVVRLA